jgi:hypothetical protein
MSDLAAFLAARLDEREAAARAATPGPWGFAGGADATHVAAHDPAWVLRDVAAKRAILAECVAIMADSINFTSGEQIRAEDTMRQLAAIDSDRPDYGAGWAP